MHKIKSIAATTAIASVAAVGSVQVAQQTGVIKFAGDVTVRSPLVVESMPPLSFDAVQASLIQLTDADGPLVVPSGKRAIVLQSWIWGTNTTHPSYSGEGGFSSTPTLRVVEDPNGYFDPNSEITLSATNGTTVLGPRDPNQMGFGSGTVLQVTDNASSSYQPNATNQQVIVIFKLVDE